MAYIEGEEEIVRRRYTEARASTGRTVFTLASSLPILASVQPLNGHDMQILPEGKREADTKKLYTETLLRVADQNVVPPVPADRVVIDGEEYEVWQARRERSASHIPHYKVFVSRRLE